MQNTNIVSSIKSEFSDVSFKRIASNTTTNTTTNNRDDIYDPTISIQTENNLSSDEIRPGNYGYFENTEECNDDTTFEARNSQRERSKTRSRESSFENEVNNQIERNISENNKLVTSSENTDQIIDTTTNVEQGNFQRDTTVYSGEEDINKDSTALDQNVTSNTRNKNLKRKRVKIPLMLRRIQSYNKDPRQLRKRRKIKYY